MAAKLNREDVVLGGLITGQTPTDTTSTPSPKALPNRAVDWQVLAPGTTGQVLTVQAGGSIAWAGLGTFTAVAGAFSGGIAAWGATVPSSQPTAAAETTGYAAGSSTAVTIDGTFTGGTGSTAYTVGDIVAALKTQGFIKS